MDERLTSIGERLNVAEYQIVALGQLLRRTSLAGKRVLEVGGSSLPRSLVIDYLDAKEWIAVDIIDQGTYQLSRQAAHYELEGIHELGTSSDLLGTKDYIIFNGAIEDATDLPPSYFDLVVSITAFEHILALPSALETIKRVKSQDGPLFSYHGPIWSSACGHHVWVDQEINFNNPGSLPPFAHLLYSPPEMFELLTNRYASRRAEQTVLQMFHLPRINRLFYEDYRRYLLISGLGEIEISPYGQSEISDGLQARLELRHPGYRTFDAYGMIVFAR